MFSTKHMIISTAAFVALVQLCPAPFVGAIPPAAAAAVTTASSLVTAIGTTTGAVLKGAKDTKDHRRARREQGSKRGASVQTWGFCRNQLGVAHVEFSAPAAGSVHVKGLPPACMTLMPDLTDRYDQGNPIPVGDDSVLFHNVPDKWIEELQEALERHPPSK
ncbi:hypothetical protein F4818DRAFT_456378 [Hypoxylon cercidicola]|nr:hypothetical protein F4818DRAFT_456378 [Hypoxylon cercidicola]